MISLLLVDDNGAIRESVRLIVERAEDMQVVATADNGINAVEKARTLRPDVAVMDISMPLMDGLEATEQIRECCRLTRVIILSGQETPDYIRRAIEVGAKGYVLKENIAEELLEAIRTIHQGSHYFCKKIAEIAKKFISNI